MRFKVQVTLTVEKTYTYEIEAAKESKAEDAAMDKAVDAFRADFSSRRDLYDDTEFLTEKITNDCPDCGVEYVLDSAEAWHEDNDHCAKCGAKIEAEEAAAGRT